MPNFSLIQVQFFIKIFENKSANSKRASKWFWKAFSCIMLFHLFWHEILSNSEEKWENSFLINLLYHIFWLSNFCSEIFNAIICAGSTSALSGGGGERLIALTGKIQIQNYSNISFIPLLKITIKTLKLDWWTNRKFRWIQRKTAKNSFSLIPLNKKTKNPFRFQFGPQWNLHSITESKFWTEFKKRRSFLEYFRKFWRNSPPPHSHPAFFNLMGILLYHCAIKSVWSWGHQILRKFKTF